MQEQSKIVIFGHGGQAREVAEVALSLGWQVEAFAGRREGPPVMNTPVRAEDFQFRSRLAIIAIGEGSVRAQIAHAQVSRFSFVSLIHPRATVSPNSTVGHGCFVQAQAVVSTSVLLGDGCLVNYGATIGHDVTLGAFSTVLPNAAISGGVHIGPGTMVGAGSVVLPGLRVGAGCRIGAGAVVTENVDDGVTVVGIPARRMNDRRT